MKSKIANLKSKIKGFTLIEIIVGVALSVLIFGGLFASLSGGLRMVSQSRLLVLAQAIATEKMELIKNLPYDAVGTVAGIPPGNLLQEETILRNRATFTVRTRITYADDPFDGLSPTDTLAADYKSVRVEVLSPSDIGSTRPVVFITSLAPRGVETTAGGGTISLLVLNSLGEPVEQAQVIIRKQDAAPFVDITTYTDNTGRVLLPGAPVCSECYFVSVSKVGYSTDRTYSLAEVANPNKPYLTVLDGQVSPQSFSIDLQSVLVIHAFGSRAAGFPVLPGADFRLHGEETIGADAYEQPVYKYDEALSTDASGQLALSGMEGDSYVISLESNPAKDLSGASPFLPVTVAPGAMTQADFSAENAVIRSVLVRVETTAPSPLPGADIRLFGGGYDQSSTSGLAFNPDYGQAFFSGMPAGSYTLEVSLGGYIGSTTTVQILADEVEDVTLNPE